MFAFLKADDIINHQIRKGLLPKISGTFEHTAQMANVINTARIKQKSLVVTLLDLKMGLVKYTISLFLRC